MYFFFHFAFLFGDAFSLSLDLDKTLSVRGEGAGVGLWRGRGFCHLVFLTFLKHGIAHVLSLKLQVLMRFYWWPAFICNSSLLPADSDRVAFPCY